jgi:hypothetical protein
MATSQENSATQGGEPSALDLLGLGGGPDSEDARAQEGQAAAGEAAAQTGEGAPGGEAPAEGQPSWPEEFRRSFPTIAAKFKDLFALARSYQELERDYHLSRQGNQVPEVDQGEPEAPAEEATGGVEDRSAFLDRFVESPREALRSEIIELFRTDEALTSALLEKVLLSVDVVSQTRDVWQQLKEKYPDAEQVEAKMSDLVLRGNVIPGLLQAGYELPQAVELVYHIAKGWPFDAVDRARQEAAAQERQRVLQQVRSATVESGAGGGAPPAPKSPERQVIEEILAVETGRPTMTPA